MAQEEIGLPTFVLDSDLPESDVKSLLSLEASIHNEPGRLLDICNTMSADPTDEERLSEPLIDLILLATDKSTGLYFDTETEEVIAQDERIRQALEPRRGGFGRLPLETGAEHRLAGQDLRRTRLALYISRVAEINQSLAIPKELPQLAETPSEQSKQTESTGKSDAAAA